MASEKVKAKAVMRKVVSVIERRYENVSRTYNSMTISYRKLIAHTLECGHVVKRHGHVGITPSKRLKCDTCTKGDHGE